MRAPALLAVAGCVFAMAGCTSPNSASAPLRAAMVAEALYAGPLAMQAAETEHLEKACQVARDGRAAPAVLCRYDSKGQSALTIGGVLLLEPADAGVALHAWYLSWTQIYRLWDRAFAKEYTVEKFFIADVPAVRKFWRHADDSDRYSSLFESFATLKEVSKLDYVPDQNALAYAFETATRDLLEARIASLVAERAVASAADKRRLEGQIRSHLEVLAGVHQLAERRVASLESIALEEAGRYAELKEQTRSLVALQRNITNHLMDRDLVVSVDEVEAVFESSRETLERIRKSVEEARDAERKRQAEGKVPDWAERVGRALNSMGLER